MSEPIEHGKHWSEVLNELNAENARLKAEVERLRRAGDAMALKMSKMKMNPSQFSSLMNWNAAKEGKPSV